MERIKKQKKGHLGVLIIVLLYVLISLILLAERSGIRYSYNWMALRLLPDKSIVTAEEAMEQVPVRCLVLYDSTNPTSLSAWEEFKVILPDMKVGHRLIDVSKTDSYSFSDYETAIVILNDLSALGQHLIPMCDWVYEGGGVYFPLTLLKEHYFSAIETKLGISESSYDPAPVDSIYVTEDFMVGGGMAFPITDSWDSAMALQLADDDRITVHAYTDDQWQLPLIWECRYGAGEFVVNNFGLCEKGMRGFFVASYSLLTDICVYPVINGSVFYLDDFPSQIPDGNSEYIQRDYGATIHEFYVNIWWPDMMAFSDRYGLRYTGLAIETYNDTVDGTTDAQPDTGTFVNFGNMLLRQKGEIGYHGFNHQPLCLGNSDYKGKYDYKTWKNPAAMKSAFDELIGFCQDLFPGVHMSVYVPPSNLLSAEGKSFLMENYPHIKTISGTYFEEADLDFACTQEFSVLKNGVVDQPRIISGCYVEPFMRLAAISELNYHYVNSHFTHPDDALDPERGAEMGWEKMKSHFDEYLSWLYTAAPNLRNLTGTELSAAVQRYAAITVNSEIVNNRLELSLGNFHDEAQLMIRFNEHKPQWTIGGELEQLTDTLYLLHASSNTVTITLE